MTYSQLREKVRRHFQNWEDTVVATDTVNAVDLLMADIDIYLEERAVEVEKLERRSESAEGQELDILWNALGDRAAAIIRSKE